LKTFECDFFFLKKKVVLHPDEQTILVNWYNSLTSTGSLNWNIATNLCGQTGIICDDSSPYKRVIKMYSLNFLFSIFSMRKKKKKKKKNE